jgi:hypothetical protein
MDMQHGWTMQHRHGHAAWTDIHHGHGDAAWTWTCSGNTVDMLQGHGQEAWTWTCSMDKDMSVQHDIGHKAWT